MEHSILIDDIHSNPDAWLELKRGRIGSSEIATVAGLNPYQSRLSLWLEKTGQTDRQPEQLRMKMGKIKEPIIAALFEEQTGIGVVRNEKAYSLKDYPWAIATPDYLIQVEEQGAQFTAILEIKNVSAYSRKDWFTSEEDSSGESIPNYAHCQVQWQMGVSGIKRAKICALIGDNELVVRNVDFDQALFDALLHLATEFMKLVDTNEPPAPEANDVKNIAKMYEASDEIVELNDEAKGWVASWLYHKDEHDKANKIANAHKEKMKEAQANLMLLMKGVNTAEYKGATISFKEVVVKGHYRKESVQRRFNIKLGTDNLTEGGIN